MNEEKNIVEEDGQKWTKTNPLTPGQNKFVLAAIIVLGLLIIAYIGTGILEMLKNQAGG